MTLHLDRDILQAALAGYELQLAIINAQIAKIRSELKQPVPSDGIATPTRKRRRVSPTARAKMAAAQRARWTKVERARNKVAR